MTEYVIVPKKDLQDLEHDRVQLYELLEEQIKESPEFHYALSLITQRLWRITNRKYPEFKDGKQIIKYNTEFIAEEL